MIVETKRRGQYGAQQLQLALKAAEKCKNLKKVARDFNIPYSTFYQKFRNQVSSIGTYEVDFSGRKSSTLCSGCLKAVHSDTSPGVREACRKLLDADMPSESIHLCLECSRLIEKLVKFKRNLAKCAKLLQVKRENGDNHGPLSECVPAELFKYCSMCDKFFKFALVPHLVECHTVPAPLGVLECRECYFVIDSRDRVRSHFVEKHLKRNSVCRECKEVFVDFREYKRHLISHRLYECHFCARTYSSRALIRGHLLTKHSAARRCYICSEVFLDEMEYKKHMEDERLHRAGRKAVCDVCGFEAASLLSLVGHKNRRHATEEFACEVCGRIFRSKPTYQWHFRNHHGPKKFVCYCEKKFADKAQLNLHLRRKHKVSVS